MDLEFLAQADRATLNLEMAKKAIETAKAEFENAKRAYDELFSQAEAHGVPKAKLKKLTEERVQALLESGILQRERTNNEPKRDKPAKKKAKAEAAEENGDTEMVDQLPDADFIEAEYGKV